FHESWERLKELIRKCPHHAIPKWQLVQCFYDGLTAQNRQMVDASCGGIFMYKSEDEAWQLFEALSENSLQHLSSRIESSAMGTQKKGGIYEVSQIETTNAKVDILSQKLDKVLTIGTLPTKSTQTSTAHEACALCANPTHYMKSVSFESGEKETVGQYETEVTKASTSKESEQKGKEKDITLATPKEPFPECLRSPSLVPPLGKKVGRMEEMMELFKQVKINLPLLDAIQQVLAYAKFLKDLCTTKRKLKTHILKMVHLIEQVSAVLSNKLPPKLKHPRSPLISCKIGNLQLERALLDLGASVNLLPSSVYEKLGLRELRPTTMTLQLADRSVKVPRGKIEDVLIKVGEFFFPVDFVVLDTQPVANLNDQIPVILGRPFLATSNALINCRNGLMRLSFGDTSVDFNVFRLGKNFADFD
ncbi:gag-asp_proteas domain-containing protein, partial [Cephalotus follicularis]